MNIDNVRDILLLNVDSTKLSRILQENAILVDSITFLKKTYQNFLFCSNSFFTQIPVVTQPHHSENSYSHGPTHITGHLHKPKDMDFATSHKEWRVMII